MTLRLSLLAAAAALLLAAAPQAGAASYVKGRVIVGYEYGLSHAQRGAIARADASTRTTREEAADAERRLRALQTDLTAQITAATSLSRSIEGYSGVPTVDQRRQIEWAFEDAQETIGALNRALHADGAAAPQPLSIPRRH